MKTKYLEFLSELYLKSPAYVLTVLSGNPSYSNAGNEVTLRTFKTLEPLYTGQCSHRAKVWWEKRHPILQALKVAHLVTEDDMLKFY